MKTWRVSLALRPSEEVCRGKLGVGGNYVWCLVIAIFMGLGGAQRCGEGGFTQADNM